MADQIIDVHSHALLPGFLRALALKGGGVDSSGAYYGVMMPPWSLEQHIEMMDRHGIGTCVLSLPGLNQVLAGNEGRAIARSLNEDLAAIVAKYPQRFGAFAVLPMDDMDAANEEMAYALDVLKLDGVGTSTHRSGLYLGEPEYGPWFTEMDRRGVTLFVHPVAPVYFDPAASRLNVAVLEFMFDTTRMVTSMVLSGAKQKYAKINIIATHGGGTIPYLAHRISISGQMPWAYRGGVMQSVPEILAAFGSFYYDLTASTVAASLDSISKLVSPDRLLMGFDFPLMPEHTIAPAIAAFDAFPGHDADAKNKIIEGNAMRLFPRLADLRKRSSSGIEFIPSNPR